MNRLQLARRLASKCGEARDIRTLDGAVGLVADYRDWIDDAWRDLQNNIGWRWMRRQFLLTTDSEHFATPTGAGSVYPVTSLVDADTEVALAGVQRYRLQDRNDPPEIAQRTSEDPDTYGNWTYLILTDWGAWKWLYHFHNSSPSRPAHIAVTPHNGLAIGPGAPQDVVYGVRGDYYAQPNEMRGDADVPEGLPEAYHMLLVYDAMIHYGFGRLAPEIIEESQRMSASIRTQLESVQSDPMRLAPPLL